MLVFLAYFPYFEKYEKKYAYAVSMLSMRLYVHPVNFWMPQPISIKFIMHILAPDPISTA
jgi:hypothetical protein